MKFTESCTVITGEDGRHDKGMLPGEQPYLEAQLSHTVTSGSFILNVDKTGLVAGASSTTSVDHGINVGYEGVLDGHTLAMLIKFRGGDKTVKWISTSQESDVFEFTGPIVVAADGVGGLKGKKGRRAIECGGAGTNLVRATVTRPPA
jgi:hypothetical protein